VSAYIAGAAAFARPILTQLALQTFKRESYSFRKEYLS